MEILEQLDLLCFGIALALLGLLLLAIRRCLLPWPIPGIPYDKEAANRILGDIPSVRERFEEEKGRMLTDTTGCPMAERDCRDLELHSKEIPRAKIASVSIVYARSFWETLGRGNGFSRVSRYTQPKAGRVRSLGLPRRCVWSSTAWESSVGRLFFRYFECLASSDEI